MIRDSIHLNAHFGAMDEVSTSYGEASKARSGTAFGVELRTLAAARRALADRFADRLRDLGAEPRQMGPLGVIDISTLVAADPREGAAEVLRGERLLIEDLAASGRDEGLSDDTRALILAALPAVRAHAHRVETFLHTL